MTSSLFGDTAANLNSASPLVSTAAVSPRQLRDDGLKRAAAHRQEALDLARLLAEMLAHKQGLVSADDVFELMDPKALGNAAGLIFSGPQWEPVGFKQSRRLGRRCGTQRVWRLK